MENGINELTNSIKQRFEALPPLSPNCCIYRIPKTLLKVKKSNYKPCHVSIGPFHYGKKRLQSMQDQKMRYLQNFLRKNEDRTLKDYLGAIRQWEKETREYYVEVVELGTEEFVEMLLLDAVFVIEFFLTWHFDDAHEADRIFSKPSLECVIKRDLLLLENQIPFFVLDGLYTIAFGDDTSFPSFVDLTCEVLVGHYKGVSEKFDNREVLHLVDFLRTYYLPPSLRDLDNLVDDYSDWEFPPTVEGLVDAGVKFKVARDQPLLNISFENGVLRIPPLDVEDHTESMLLNLSAFEQCHYHFDSYIVDYVVFMDVLITSLKDVDILMTNGIVSNYLGSSEDVADVFNTICKGTTYQARKFYYSRLCREMSAYAKKPWNKWRAALNHDYFSNPWTIISVIVAVILLILTVIQTVCTVISME